MSSATSARAAHTSRRRIMHVGSLSMILGGLLLAAGSLLPWVSTPMGHLSGAAGAGLWTLCAGMIAIAGALIPRRNIAFTHALIPGLAGAFFALWQVVRILQVSASTDSWGKLLPGMGLVLVAGASVFLLRAAMRIRAAG